IWVNPLLRFDGFSAKAQGVRAMLPHVDAFRPIHNLASMADLCKALAGMPDQTRDPKAWLRETAA
ncbi:MAG TPA: VWA domain-containing protein, partial [Roseiarcus sp.]|nr:VWA domain-containing protein [Roseiarcus sp.]